MTGESSEMNVHLSDDSIAAYLDGVLPEPERASVEAHLSVCDECRTEIIRAREAITNAPGDQGIGRVSWRMIALIAASMVIVIGGATLFQNERSVRPVRNAADNVAGVEVVSPADGSFLGGDRHLNWRSTSAESYRVTISRSSGQPIYSVTTADTTLVLPDSILRGVNAKLFWYVDAIRRDGSIATSGLKSFTVK